VGYAISVPLMVLWLTCDSLEMAPVLNHDVAQAPPHGLLQKIFRLRCAHKLLCSLWKAILSKTS